MTLLAPRTLTLRLDFPSRELQPNGRPNRYAKADAVRAYRYDAKAEAKRVMGTTYRPGDFPLRTPVKADVTFVVTDDRRHDTDNLIASIKAGWDGMVDARLLLDDHSKVLTWGEPRVVKGDKAEVVVVLTEGAVCGGKHAGVRL